MIDKNKPIRLIELFAGVGSQAKALQRLNADFEHYKISEWEVNATASYKAIHKENDNTDYSADFNSDELTDILFNIGISTDGKKPLTLKEIARKGEQWKRTVYNNFKATNNIGSILNVKGEDLGIVDTDTYTYLLTYSFPCQDLSLAGKGKGMAKDSGTRSGLLWEVERLLNECDELPQILLMENVTQVHGKKNKEHFDEWIRFLENKGYNNYWQDLNAKNYGIPQNRNRTFMVSMLGNYTYEFPKEFPLKLRLKDMLEDSVDEKFYLSGKMVNYFKENTIRQQAKGNGFKFQPTDGNCVGKAVTTRAGGRMDDNFIEEPVRLGGLFDTEKSKHQAGSIWDKETLAPTIDTMQGGYRQPLVTEEPQIVQIPHGYMKGNVQKISPSITTSSWESNNLLVEPLAYDEQNGYLRKDGTVGTLTTDGSSPKHNNRVVEPFIVASRGRNPENPSDRRTGVPTEQRLEPNFSGCSNTLTTVQKDNYVAEPTERVIENCYVSEKGVKYILDAKRGMATDVNADVCQPLTAKGQANWTGSFVSPDIENLEKSSTIGSTEPTKINLKDGSQITSNDNLSGLRIRKLTPKECWRLMGFDDADFDKAAEVNSNSQLYKQAGNSIVVDVLYYIFREML